jgi:hypothetical protein
LGESVGREPREPKSVGDDLETSKGAPNWTLGFIDFQGPEPGRDPGRAQIVSRLIQTQLLLHMTMTEIHDTLSLSLPVSGHFVRSHRKTPNIDNKKEKRDTWQQNRHSLTRDQPDSISGPTPLFGTRSHIRSEKKRRLKKDMIKRNNLKQNMDNKVQG